MWSIALLTCAHAQDELSFTPDRPGVGDSTGTTGRGHVMIEGGLAGQLGQGPAVFGTSGLTGRFGVARGVELRLRLPDLVLAETLGVGTMGVGAKVGGDVSERWSVSFLSELSVDPNDGTDVIQMGASMGGNVALALGDFGLWAASSAAGEDGPVVVVAGGGVSWGVEQGGVFLHGGHTFGDAPFVGLGGWWMLGEALQLDLGCDLGLASEGVLVLPQGGVVVGF
jgi:hypothetical protein